MTFKPFEHQTETTNFILSKKRCFVASDPGTGKTRSCLDAINQIKGKTLVLAPLSILQPSWGNDCETFTPDEEYVIAYAKNRAKAFNSSADIYITNHDAVKWIEQQLKKDSEFLKGFTALIIDECVAFKNNTSQRSKALRNISEHFEYIVEMSGTLNSNSVLDTWHPTFILDRGHRLGPNYFKFRSQVCEKVQVGPQPQMCEWRPRPEATENVGALLSDITIRHTLEDCIDIPERTTRHMYVELPNKIKKLYEEFERDSILLTEQGVVNAVNAGARAQKLLQLCTGAIYDEMGDAHFIHTQRYELVIDLIQERVTPSLVAFNWKHERKALVELAEKQGISYAVIDGEVSISKRNDIVKEFAAGNIQVLFAHPQSAAHGLTFTKAKTTIWSSPTYRGEWFQQFNRRTYRAGQTDKTEVILITASGTREEQVYEVLDQKLSDMEVLQQIFSANTKYAEVI